MREIKFRAWDENNKVMHFDFQFIKSGDESNDWIVFTSDKQKLIEPPHPFENPYSQQQLKIMQYTGLKDKNGVEIYESDIVKIHIGHEEWLDKSMIVEWIDGAFCLHIPGREKVTSLIFYADGVQVRRGHRNIGQFIKVIGNIYEHPQLTEAK